MMPFSYTADSENLINASDKRTKALFELSLKFLLEQKRYPWAAKKKKKKPT